MKTQRFKFLLIVLMGFTLMATISCEGPEGPQGEQGPQGETGQQGPVGNANVNRYIFSGWDPSILPVEILEIGNITSQEFEESIWLTYLILEYEDGIDAYPIPGYGVLEVSYYAVELSSFDTDSQLIAIYLNEGPGEVYDSIIVFQIPSNITMDMTSKSLPYALPQDLDISDYNAVMNYFGDSVNTIRY